MKTGYKKVLVSITVFVLLSFSNVKANEAVLETLGCMLEPSKKVQVSSPVAGVIDSVKVKRGDHIKKNDILFQLNAGVEKELVELARVKVEFSGRKLERNRKLYNDDILSVHERDEIETELITAEAELRLKEQELKLRTVYSPISGVIVNQLFNKGEYVNVDPVIHLATLNPLHVDLLLPARYFGKISVNEELMIKPETDIIRSKKAKVIIVDPLIDPASGTFRVRLKMDNPKNKIPAGIRCSAQTINKVNK